MTFFLDAGVNTLPESEGEGEEAKSFLVKTQQAI